MTKKKSYKHAMEFVPRPREELDLLFAEHIDALQSLCQIYDYGKKHFAAEIALNLRVLFSDTPGSENRSLLAQLRRDSEELFDTAKTMNDADPNSSVMPAEGLVCQTLLLEGDQVVEAWEPNIHMLQKKQSRYTKFPLWWEANILKTKSGQLFSRRRMVRQLANQDRGGHVSPGIEKSYYELTRNSGYGGGTKIIQGDAVSDPNAFISPERIIEVSSQGSGTKLLRALIRQIAHETLMSMLPDPQGYLDTVPVPNPGIAPATMWVQFFHDPGMMHKRY